MVPDSQTSRVLASVPEDTGTAGFQFLYKEPNAQVNMTLISCPQ